MTDRILLPKVSFVKLHNGDLGDWTAPKGVQAAKPGTIRIDTRLKGQKKMEVLIHEHIHEFFPDLSEEKTAITAFLLAVMLHKQGYRETLE